jgi:hypothetical protein
VVFEPKEEHRSAIGGIITAKLFVKCSSKPDIPPWVFYLRGTITGDITSTNKKR